MTTVVSLESRIKRMLVLNFQIENFDDLVAGNNCIQNSNEYFMMFKNIMKMNIDTFIKYTNLEIIKKEDIENYIVKYKLSKN